MGESHPAYAHNACIELTRPDPEPPRLPAQSYYQLGILVELPSGERVLTLAPFLGSHEQMLSQSETRYPGGRIEWGGEVQVIFMNGQITITAFNEVSGYLHDKGIPSHGRALKRALEGQAQIRLADFPDFRPWQAYPEQHLYEPFNLPIPGTDPNRRHALANALSALLVMASPLGTAASETPAGNRMTLSPTFWTEDFRAVLHTQLEIIETGVRAYLDRRVTAGLPESALFEYELLNPEQLLEKSRRALEPVALESREAHKLSEQLTALYTAMVDLQRFAMLSGFQHFVLEPRSRSRPDQPESSR